MGTDMSDPNALPKPEDEAAVEAGVVLEPWALSMALMMASAARTAVVSPLAVTHSSGSSKQRGLHGLHAERRRDLRRGERRYDLRIDARRRHPLDFFQLQRDLR